MESSQKSIIGQGTVNRAGQGRAGQTQALVERAQGASPGPESPDCPGSACSLVQQKEQEQPLRPFKGAFTLGVRDSSVESPNTMLVI
jgi:hypothetical protein